MALRQTLIEVAAARQASEGQQTKMEMVYGYLTGPRFRQRVQAIVEAFSSMKEDLGPREKSDHPPMGQTRRTNRPSHASDRRHVRRLTGDRGEDVAGDRRTGVSGDVGFQRRRVSPARNQAQKESLHSHGINETVSDKALISPTTNSKLEPVIFAKFPGNQF